MTVRMAVIIALVAIAPEVWAETENLSRTKGSIEEFRVYTKCLGVILVVEHLSDDARKIGLRREEIVAAVESRLRAAGLYQSGYFGFPEGSVVFFPHLYVDVNVKGNAYSVLVELKKWVSEPLSGQLNFAQTWRRRDARGPWIRELLHHVYRAQPDGSVCRRVEQGEQAGREVRGVTPSVELRQVLDNANFDSPIIGNQS